MTQPSSAHRFCSTLAGASTLAFLADTFPGRAEMFAAVGVIEQVVWPLRCGDIEEVDLAVDALSMFVDVR